MRFFIAFLFIYGIKTQEQIPEVVETHEPVLVSKPISTLSPVESEDAADEATLPIVNLSEVPKKDDKESSDENSESQKDKSAPIAGVLQTENDGTTTLKPNEEASTSVFLVNDTVFEKPEIKIEIHTEPIEKTSILHPMLLNAGNASSVEEQNLLPIEKTFEEDVAIVAGNETLSADYNEEKTLPPAILKLLKESANQPNTEATTESLLDVEKALFEEEPVFIDTGVNGGNLTKLEADVDVKPETIDSSVNCSTFKTDLEPKLANPKAPVHITLDINTTSVATAIEVKKTGIEEGTVTSLILDGANGTAKTAVPSINVTVEQNSSSGFVFSTALLLTLIFCYF